jgi:hypothetical protein
MCKVKRTRAMVVALGLASAAGFCAAPAATAAPATFVSYGDAITSIWRQNVEAEDEGTFVAARGVGEPVASVAVNVNGIYVAGSATAEVPTNGRPGTVVNFTKAASRIGGTGDLITVRYTEVDGGKGTISKEFSLVAEPAPSTPQQVAEELADASGNRIPRADLKVITGAQATALADLTGTLIRGPFKTNHTVESTDFTVESDGAYTDALVTRGTSYLPLRHFDVTGLVRDAGGTVTSVGQVKQGLWNGVDAYNADVSFVNDGFYMGSGATLARSWVHDHATAFEGGTGNKQHPDCTQIGKGGGQVITDNYCDNTPTVWPTTAAGTPVPGKGPIQAASSAMIQSADASSPTTGPISVTNNYFHDTTSQQVFIGDGLDPADGSQWWVQERDADGKLTGGVEIIGNVTFGPVPDIDYNVPDALRWQQNLSSSNSAYGPDGASRTLIIKRVT